MIPRTLFAVCLALPAYAQDDDPWGQPIPPEPAEDATPPATDDDPWGAPPESEGTAEPAETEEEPSSPEPTPEVAPSESAEDPEQPQKKKKKKKNKKKKGEDAEPEPDDASPEAAEPDSGETASPDTDGQDEGGGDETSSEGATDEAAPPASGDDEASPPEGAGAAPTESNAESGVPVGGDEPATSESQGDSAGTSTPAQPNPKMPLAGAHTTSGFRITASENGTGIELRTRYVVGPDGGTNVALLGARYAYKDKLTVRATIPFTSYRTPALRDIGLGNVQLDAWYHMVRTDKVVGSLGVEAHFNVGSRSWTWANAGDETWPGWGLDLVWQGRTLSETSILYRASGGFGLAAAYAPYPAAFPRFQFALGVDRSLIDRVGIVVETSVNFWDPSPWDLAALSRVDILPGLRARAGFVLPLGVWAGATPADRPAGVREATLLLDLTLTP